MKQCYSFFLLILILALYSCKAGKEQADLIVHNARVYTVDSSFSIQEAFALKDGKFLSIGSNEEILEKYEAKERLDAGGRYVYPGFFDAHCHFFAYGKMKDQADLKGAASFEEVVQRLVKHAETHKEGWLLGRGWDHTLWKQEPKPADGWTVYPPLSAVPADGNTFPTKDTLDKLFPHRPVYLSRVDGHAALVNQAALDEAHITSGTTIEGGIVELKNGELTGILIDNAADSVQAIIPELNLAQIEQALMAAQKDCFAVGLTTVDDAGLKKHIIDQIDALQQAGKLKMRIYAMIEDNDANLDHYIPNGPFITNSLNVSSFKIYGDGALGSRGACLLEPYADRPQEQGFLLHKPEYYRERARRIAASAFQMNTHCIGDSANRFILQVYAEALKGEKDRRWRIEHAQVVAPADIALFGRYGIIPSVQPTHATSDMRWAEERLGSRRMAGAYAYKDMLNAAGIVAIGSDFPVEDINPLYGFYAAVARKDHDGNPPAGFLPGNALSREEALRGMTIWAAYSNFEETYKGSIEAGKLADFVILDSDIMEIPLNEIPAQKVWQTFLGGESVYKR